MPRKSTKPAGQSLEEALDRLDEITQQLSDGQLPLEQAITLYAEGKRLEQYCRTILDTAQLQLQRLSGIGGTTASDAADDASADGASAQATAAYRLSTLTLDGMS